MDELSKALAEAVKSIASMAPEAWAALVYHERVSSWIGLGVFALLLPLSCYVSWRGWKAYAESERRDRDGAWVIGFVGAVLAALFLLFSWECLADALAPEGAVLKALLTPK